MEEAFQSFGRGWTLLIPEYASAKGYLNVVQHLAAVRTDFVIFSQTNKLESDGKHTRMAEEPDCSVWIFQHRSVLLMISGQAFEHIFDK